MWLAMISYYYMTYGTYATWKLLLRLFLTEQIIVISNINKENERDYIFRNWRVKAELESKILHFIGNIR